MKDEESNRSACLAHLEDASLTASQALEAGAMRASRAEWLFETLAKQQQLCKSQSLAFVQHLQALPSDKLAKDKAAMIVQLKTGAIRQIGVSARKWCIFGTQTALLADFKISHVERILMSKYYQKQHLGVFWPVSRKDLLFLKRRKNLKGTFTILQKPAPFPGLFHAHAAGGVGGTRCPQNASGIVLPARFSKELTQKKPDDMSLQTDRARRCS